MSGLFLGIGCVIIIISCIFSAAAATTTTDTTTTITTTTTTTIIPNQDSSVVLTCLWAEVLGSAHGDWNVSALETSSLLFSDVREFFTWG
jgi:hypothetical protein